MTSAIAFSTTALPAVWPVTSIACMIGTPAEYRAANVRDPRARAIFWTVLPILKGIFRRRRSHCGRPLVEVRHFLNAIGRPIATAIRTYQRDVTACEAATVILVISGRSPPKSLNIFSKTGTTLMSRSAVTPMATRSTMTG